MTYQLPPPPGSVTPPPEKKRGWGWFVAGAAVILLGIGAVVGGSNDPVTPVATDTATVMPSPDTISDSELLELTLDEHPETTAKWCDGYETLSGFNYSDAQIIAELERQGAFDTIDQAVPSLSHEEIFEAFKARC